jgi:acyl dehydratase
MATKTVSKEELLTLAGTELPTSDWLTLSQERVNTFADCTEDHQFIHVDQEKAKQTPFGGTIAHGFLTLSVLPKLAENALILPENLVFAMNYGFDKVRFLAPVRVGKRVRMKGKIISVEAKGDDRFLVKTGVSIEIEDEETPALIAEWLNMYVCG